MQAAEPMPISAQTVGAHTGIAPIVFGAGDTEPIAQAVELLGIDRVDGEAPIQQGIDDGAVRHLERDGNRTYVACERQNPVTLLYQTGAAMRKLAFSGDAALSIKNAGLVLLGSSVDSGKPKDFLLNHDASPSIRTRAAATPTDHVLALEGANFLLGIRRGQPAGAHVHCWCSRHGIKEGRSRRVSPRGQLKPQANRTPLDKVQDQRGKWRDQVDPAVVPFVRGHCGSSSASRARLQPR